MDVYVFKLNLEPYILKSFNYESNSDQVKGKIIPSSLSEIFTSREVLSEALIKYGQTVEIDNVKESEEFKELIEISQVMEKMYQNVVQKFEENGEILYSSKFMETRDKLDKSIRHLVERFSFLSIALELPVNVFKVEAYSSVKMAVTYIQRAKKIEYFINSSSTNRTVSDFIYDKETEQIYLPIESLEESDALKEAKLIENKINMFSHQTNIGRVTINPIYEDFELQGLYSEITIELVYPNGDPARDRSKAIEQGNAARETIKYEASKDQKMDISSFNVVFKEDAERGYIQSVKSKGKKIFAGLLKTIKIDT